MAGGGGVMGGGTILYSKGCGLVIGIAVWCGG
jgi:hypothetical protein